MDNSETSSKPPESEEERKPPRTSRNWRTVDPAIWSTRGPAPKGIRKITPVLERLGFALLHPVALPLLAMAGVTGFIGTFAIAYYLGGPGLFGPILLSIWGALITAGVLVLEKTGYARNFQAWDLPARKILYGNQA